MIFIIFFFADKKKQKWRNFISVFDALEDPPVVVFSFCNIDNKEK